MLHPTAAYLARLALQAHALYAPPDGITLGTITLLPHQVAAVHWLQHRITRFGGALLADPPGLGKTYVALAIAALRGVRPLVIAPAALRARWKEAADSTAVAIEFISTERLSAPAATRVGTPAFVVIDEAHHLRTAHTRRYRRTAALCERARVLLLTATPIHNRPQDLEQLTALFHLPAERASISALRRLTLRRTLAQIHAAGLVSGTHLHIPAVTHRTAMTARPRAGAITHAITRLPPIADTDREGHTLLCLGLLHALQSSDAACASRVRRRIAGTLAIEAAARAQVMPTAAFRRAWQTGDDAIQLAMPELLGSAAPRVDPALEARAKRQRRALEQLLPMLDGAGDQQRATALRRMARWCDRPVVAFTQFAATADALYRRLQTTPGIALLCGDEARIASGVASRAEVLERLLSADRRAHTAVRLLITTDVLSEGLSLSGVATIVHLDLPWTAARLDQRIGRAARIGAGVPSVRVVELPASVPVGTDARLRALVRRKRGHMTAFEQSAAVSDERIALTRHLACAGGAADAPRCRERWLTVHSPAMGHARLRVIALVRMRGRRQLVALSDDGLRASDRDDWYALHRATRWHVGVSGRVRTWLRMTLRDHADEEDLRRMLEKAGDARLAARREVDGRLFAGTLQQRLALAPRVTSARRGVMRRTSAGQLRGIAELIAAIDAQTALREHALDSVDPSDDRIAIYACIAIRPA